AELDEIVRLTSLQPMDLSASIFRTVLFTRAENEHVLLLVAHPIRVGAHRMRLMLRDLRALYLGDPLPPAPAREVDASATNRPAAWNRSRAPRRTLRDSRAATLHGLLAGAVAGQPDAPAIIEGDS